MIEDSRAGCLAVVLFALIVIFAGWYLPKHVPPCAGLSGPCGSTRQ